MVIALAIEVPAVLVGAVVGILVLGVAWFAVRFWLASTRPVAIKEVRTPTLDRLNEEALGQMGDDSEEEDDEAPAELQQPPNDSPPSSTQSPPGAQQDK